MYKLLYNLYARIVFSYHYRFRKGTPPLKDFLIKNNQTRWFDIGASVNYDPDFYFSDIKEPEELPEAMRAKYIKLDITKPLTTAQLNQLGQFDFIRMQHVFEHFTLEDGLVVLENCYKLLNSKGYLLITVPDLEIFIKRYRYNCLALDWPFTNWAHTRIPQGAPQSMYFSIYTHSVLHERHLWCYDKEGLAYQLTRSGKFKSIQRLSLFNPLASIPFSHNRPLEDLCMLAQKN